jgi:arabinan endo-1,5-alpha-L-arabinosidase
MRILSGKRLRVASLTVAAMALVLVFPQTADAAAPSPVFAPADSVADPGVLRDNGDFYVFTTGDHGTVYKGNQAGGPYTKVGGALNWNTLPDWVDPGPAIWAPDAWQVGDHYVLYYSAVAKNFGGERCIGVATSNSLSTPFTALTNDPPLVCPGGRHGGEDRVGGSPNPNNGVIDPSPFVDSDGQRFLLYKTQGLPATLRMVRLGPAGEHWFGNASGELRQSNDRIIENPVMVQRGNQFVLMASKFNYATCDYATVYWRSTNKWNFAGAAEHPLLNQGTAGGICGPGGADVTPSLDGGWRIFLHGWLCGNSPCTDAQRNAGNGRRALYAAILNWGSDGASPDVGAFL